MHPAAFACRNSRRPRQSSTRKLLFGFICLRSATGPGRKGKLRAGAGGDLDGDQGRSLGKSTSVSHTSQSSGATTLSHAPFRTIRLRKTRPLSLARRSLSLQASGRRLPEQQHSDAGPMAGLGSAPTPGLFGSSMPPTLPSMRPTTVPDLGRQEPQETVTSAASEQAQQLPLALTSCPPYPPQALYHHQVLSTTSPTLAGPVSPVSWLSPMPGPLMLSDPRIAMSGGLHRKVCALCISGSRVPGSTQSRPRQTRPHAGD